MLGAIIGDIVGSPYEFDYNSNKSKEFPLFCTKSRFTDDTVMTTAVADALLKTFPEGKQPPTKEAFQKELVESMKFWGLRYQYASYGARFALWLSRGNTEPYNSFGNGSAMRVSPVAWAFDSLEHVEKYGRYSAEVTHNHPEGIKGAQTVAAAIFLARTGHSIAEIKTYCADSSGYNLSRTLEEIRPSYHHVESCQESVPESIIAFLEATDFEDTLRNAVSLGGDADTQAAIAGSIAEAYFGIPDWITAKALAYVDEPIQEVIERWKARFGN